MDTINNNNNNSPSSRNDSGGGGDAQHLAQLQAALLFEVMQNNNNNNNNNSSSHHDRINNTTSNNDAMDALHSMLGTFRNKNNSSSNNSNSSSNNNNNNSNVNTNSSTGSTSTSSALSALFAARNAQQQRALPPSHHHHHSYPPPTPDAFGGGIPQQQQQQRQQHAFGGGIPAPTNNTNTPSASTSSSSPYPSHLPPMPASIAAFASLPLPRANQPLPPLNILEGDLAIFEYIAKRARATADHIDSSLGSIRLALDQWRSMAPPPTAAGLGGRPPEQQHQHMESTIPLNTATAATGMLLNSTTTNNNNSSTVKNASSPYYQQHHHHASSHPMPPFTALLHGATPNNSNASKAAAESRLLHAYTNMQTTTTANNNTNITNNTMEESTAASLTAANEDERKVAELAQRFQIKAPPPDFGSVPIVVPPTTNAANSTNPSTAAANRKRKKAEKEEEARMIAASMIHRFAVNEDDDRKPKARQSAAANKNNNNNNRKRNYSVDDDDNNDNNTNNQKMLLASSAPPPDASTASSLSAFASTHNNNDDNFDHDHLDDSGAPSAAMVRFVGASESKRQKSPQALTPLESFAKSKHAARRKTGELVAFGDQGDYILSPNEKREKNRAHGKSVEYLTWPQLLSDCEWLTPNDVGISLDSVLISLAQFKVCALTQDDRIGRYMQQEIGYIGLCCKHCFGQPGYGRYFPSTLPSFVSSFPGTATRHIGEDCPGCPDDIKTLVNELETLNQKSPVRRPDHTGSKGLLQSVWNSLRETKLETVAASDDAKINKALQIAVAENGQGITWGALLGGSELVVIQDRHLVPDTLYAAFAQFEKCYADEIDCNRSGRYKSPKAAFPGMCCRYCRGVGYTAGSRIFPVNTLGLGLTDNCNKMVKHVTTLCPKCPESLRVAFAELYMREKKGTRRYGSRKIFFRRIWMRLHGEEPEAAEGFPVAKSSGADSESEETEEDDEGILSIEKLIEKSQLVSMSERGMVSEAHFVAFAQLKPCLLEESDQAGWYKDREVGFPGVCCLHCNGRPSSGRYFPKSGDNFLRSSKHSIIRHITENCASCPQDVRMSLIKLQQRDAARSSWKIVDDSVLGAGKLFHERIWIRLYEILKVPPGQYDALDRSNSSNVPNMTSLDNNKDERASLTATGAKGEHRGIELNDV